MSNLLKRKGELMFKINDQIEFHYLKETKTDLKAGQRLKDYVSTSESYSGAVVDIRNIVEQPVSQDTIRRDNIKGSRSKKLYTVDLGNDTVKSFYDGRMVGTKVSVPTKKSAFRIFAEKLLGRKTKMAS